MALGLAWPLGAETKPRAGLTQGHRPACILSDPSGVLQEVVKEEEEFLESPLEDQVKEDMKLTTSTVAHPKHGSTDGK